MHLRYFDAGAYEWGGDVWQIVRALMRARNARQAAVPPFGSRSGRS